jgi:hypothetical protein
MNWNQAISAPAWCRTWSCCAAYCLAFGLVLLNGCAMAETGGHGSPKAPVPDGAIPVGPDLYMLPMGSDETGCPMFQPWSPTLMVVQALHWRAADGSFTLDRDAADCPPPEDTPQNDTR